MLEGYQFQGGSSTEIEKYPELIQESRRGPVGMLYELRSGDHGKLRWFYSRSVGGSPASEPFTDRNRANRVLDEVLRERHRN